MTQDSELRITSPKSMPELGLSVCPGKIDPFAHSGPCFRNLEADVQTIKNWGAAIVVTLMEAWELHRLHVASLGEAVKKAGMDWHFLEVVDGSPLMLAKSASITTSMDDECKSLLKAARLGKKIFIHCRGGLGRTGTLAARLLIENGLEPEAAISEVREARKGAIETALQEYYLLYKAWLYKARENRKGRDQGIF